MIYNRFDHCVVRTDGREVSAQFLATHTLGTDVITCKTGRLLRVQSADVRPEMPQEAERRTQAGYYVEE